MRDYRHFVSVSDSKGVFFLFIRGFVRDITVLSENVVRLHTSQVEAGKMAMTLSSGDVGRRKIIDIWQLCIKLRMCVYLIKAIIMRYSVICQSHIKHKFDLVNILTF